MKAEAEKEPNVMGSTARDGESPVGERGSGREQDPEYDETRVILSESGMTICQG